MRTRKAKIFASILVMMPVAACMDDASLQDAPLDTGGKSAVSACVNAVDANYGEKVARVTSSEFSQANTMVMLTAKGENWRCLASEDGIVADLSVVE